MNNMDEKEQLKLVRAYPDNIRRIKNPTENVKWEAIKIYQDAIKYIKNPSEEMQLYAVRENGFALRLLENPSIKVQKEAIMKEGSAIKYIKNPSEEFQKIAVFQNPAALIEIEHPSEELQLHCMKTNPYLISYITNPTKKIAFEAFLEIYEHSFYKDFFAPTIHNNLFDALKAEKKGRFLKELPDYQEELEHKPYFQALLHYLFLFHMDWVKESLQVLTPLNTEQEAIWKAMRLKHIF